MMVIEDLRQTYETLERALKRLEVAEFCLRALCKPFRTRPLGRDEARKLWLSLKTLFLNDEPSKLPALIRQAVIADRRTPPDEWVRDVQQVAEIEDLGDIEIAVPYDDDDAKAVIAAVGQAWNSQRNEFENSDMKQIARVFLDRMKHVPNGVITEDDVLRRSWAIWFKPAARGTCKDPGIRADIEEKGGYAATSWTRLKHALSVGGLTPLSTGAHRALERIKEVVGDFTSEGRRDLSPTDDEIEREAIRIVEDHQPNAIARQDLDSVAHRVCAGDLTLSGYLEARCLRKEICKRLRTDIHSGKLDVLLERAVDRGALHRMSIGPEVYYLSPKGESQDRPLWDSAMRQLCFRGKVVKRYGRHPSPNQTTILRAFEEEDWPRRIDDPLPEACKERLRETVKALNRGARLSGLHFSADGTGEGVIWQIVASVLSR